MVVTLHTQVSNQKSTEEVFCFFSMNRVRFYGRNKHRATSARKWYSSCYTLGSTEFLFLSVYKLRDVSGETFVTDSLLRVAPT
ncbi:hypothetical protein Pla52o_24930 [Novipirellula galeiformis]|uniref:Uncharacterized protein n=1 Tax=Novipirellula galeiformis TaxID=2528004 RepID=A0A5C6CED3_9BACT|nr:hypothetical protein Pla52o_24930 [Novipirellula galeiformis]